MRVLRFETTVLTLRIVDNIHKKKKIIVIFVSTQLRTLCHSAWKHAKLQRHVRHPIEHGTIVAACSISALHHGTLYCIILIRIQ